MGFHPYGSDWIVRSGCHIPGFCVCLFVCFFHKPVECKPLLICKLNHTFISKEMFRPNGLSLEFRKLMELIVTNSAVIYPDVLPALY